MSKWAVVYSSVTGNTAQIAKAIAEAAEADIFPVAEAPADFSDYDVVALGYWLRRGAPEAKMLAFLPQVTGAKVALFQTHGAEPGSEHAVTAFARAAYRLGEGCEILGTFGCQGKINPALIKKRQQGGDDDPHGGAAALLRWEAAKTHPDEQDLAAARDFVAAIERKLVLRKKYRNVSEV